MAERHICKRKHEYVTLRDCEACPFFPVCEPEWDTPKNTAMAAAEEVALPAMRDVSSVKINVDGKTVVSVSAEVLREAVRKQLYGGLSAMLNG